MFLNLFYFFNQKKYLWWNIIWRTPCSAAADPRLQTLGLGQENK